eukprot:s156_g2.t1
MSDGLFGASAPKEKVESSDERRTKLFPWDSVASQLFEPWGESSLDSLSLEQVWQGARKGNKKTRYHSRLCADPNTDGWHVGAGISQTAEVLLLAIKNWQSQDMQRLIREDLYAKVTEEIATLEPALKALNVGKGSQESRDTGSFRQAKKQKTSTTSQATPTGEQLIHAATVLHKWLSQKHSAFRSALFILAGKDMQACPAKRLPRRRLPRSSSPRDCLLPPQLSRRHTAPFGRLSFILAGKDTYYAAHAANTVARAAVFHKPLSAEHIVAAMKIRVANMAEPGTAGRGSADAIGLFN